VPFDLASGPGWCVHILELAASGCALLLSAHPLILDQRSLEIIGSALVTGECAGPPAGASWSDFRLAEKEYLASQQAQQDVQALAEKLGNVPNLEIPLDHPRPAIFETSAISSETLLPADLCARLETIRSENSLHHLTLYVAAVGCILERKAATPDFAIAVPAQQSPEWRDTTGPLTHQTLVRGNWEARETPLQTIQNADAEIWTAQKSAQLPFAQLVSQLNLGRDLGRSPLAQVAVSSACFDDRLKIDPEVIPLMVGPEASFYDLEFDVSALGTGQTGLKLRGNARLFDAVTVNRMLAEAVECLDALSRAGTEQIARPVKQTIPHDPAIEIKGSTVPEIIEAQVARTPDAPAVIFDGQSLSFAELNTSANRIAAALIRAGVGTETCVAVLHPRSPGIIASLLAVLKAGGYYLPLDPEHPRHHIQTVLSDARPKLVLTARGFRTELLEDVNIPVLAVEDCIDDTDLPMDNQERDTAPLNLAYALYTSGSTGRPKGVMIAHQSIVKNLAWRQRTWPMVAGDRVYQHYPYTFDPSVWATFLPLATGATIVLTPAEENFDAVKFASEMHAQHITVFGATPSIFSALLETRDFNRISSLRYIFSGGEQLVQNLKDKMMRQTNARVVNLYGPTEATIDASAWDQHDPTNSSHVPIGYALPHAGLRLLSPEFGDVDTGEIGQIAISGDGLARGYIARPALTAERFIPDPQGDVSGGRLYLTGDLGRRRADGAIEFAGRSDTQIKLRGYRIELGHLEACLLDAPGVQRVAALLDKRGTPRIAAFVVPSGETELNADGLRDFVKQRLPSYMVPTEIKCLATLPTTQNGKLDHSSLLDTLTPSGAANHSKTPGPAARKLNQLEEEIVGVICRLLKIPRAGLSENFFDLGGDSISVARLAAVLASEYDIELPVYEIFKDPTPEGIARLVASSSNQTIKAEDAWTPERLSQEAKLDPNVQASALPHANWSDPQHILVTGASGYLGAFLMEALLKHTSATIHAHARPTSTSTAALRVEQAMKHFGCWDEQFRSRIVVYSGDLSQPRIGLDHDTWDHLTEKIDTIYHSGALVNFVYPYSVLRRPNVSATEDILRLASTKTLKAFHYLSSIDVLLGTGGARPYMENRDAVLAPRKVPDGYPRSKLVGELLVHAAQDRGIPVSVFRLGLVMGHSQTGATPETNYLAVGLKGYLDLGILPKDENYFDIIPVDYAAKAVVAASLDMTVENRIFHLWNPAPVKMDQVYSWLQQFGYRFDVVTAKEARNLVISVDASNPLYPFVPHFRAIDPDNTPVSMFHHSIMDATDLTLEARNFAKATEGKGLTAPEVDESMVHKCLEFLVRQGFLPAPG
jgi:amino acid adenylation domain-containing protein/thioester reductase-like protein